MNADVRIPPLGPVVAEGRPREPRRRPRVPQTQTRARVRRDFADWVFLMLLFLLSIQFVQIGGAQLSQLFVVLVLPLLLVQRRITISGWELWSFGLFITATLALTWFAGYSHIKATEQIIKFAFMFPGFYLVGRYFGKRYMTRPLPYGYVVLWVFLFYQMALQYLNVPVLYQEVDFMQGALHGSFKERNWLAATFFLASYLCFLQSPRRVPDILRFLSLGLVVTLLSESKTVLIPCGIVLLFQVRGYAVQKVLLMAAGAAFYAYEFSRQFSGDVLQVKLQEERGLAFIESVKLLANDWLGHGLGFVEYYFAHSALSVKGLGEGTNAVFCSPLDLMLVAGPIGLFAWAVFFCGLGLGRRAVLLMLPLAAWSLVNPMHESETSYLFLGVLASFAASASMGRPSGSGFAQPQRLLFSRRRSSSQGSFL
ncbi:hypothetical protein PQQ51_11850 [Paraburkholderia xenovorans]|uniref:hypothetical protein n=1 Tax=Paraburkholderia xenovorans TaxID=36873 RepID=UPI0038B9C927